MLMNIITHILISIRLTIPYIIVIIITLRILYIIVWSIRTNIINVILLNIGMIILCVIIINITKHIMLNIVKDILISILTNKPPCYNVYIDWLAIVVSWLTNVYFILTDIINDIRNEGFIHEDYDFYRLKGRCW